MIVGCLALNASFEPLTMVPVKRALRLVIDGKAEIVEADSGRVVHSARLSMPRPAVIRLTRFIHVPRRFRRQVTNIFLFARDRYRCQYCGRMQGELKHREALTRDHLVPLSRGGRNDWSNVVTACSSCICGASSDVRFRRRASFIRTAGGRGGRRRVPGRRPGGRRAVR
ncbi:MAG: HNH endonuclease [Gemmatimonadaceae bacterium]